jgi:hypothetical protein
MADVNHAHTRPVAVLMVAIGGYGYHYLKVLLDEVPAGLAHLAGVVDPLAQSSWRLRFTFMCRRA